MGATPESIAAALDGMEYSQDIPLEINQAAREAGVAIIRGVDDTTVQFEGLLDDDVCAWRGVTVAVDAMGVLQPWSGTVSESAARDYFKRKPLAVPVEALWSNEPQGWTFKTPVDHAPFNTMRDGKTFCRAIAFALPARAAGAEHAGCDEGNEKLLAKWDNFQLLDALYDAAARAPGAGWAAAGIEAEIIRRLSRRSARAVDTAALSRDEQSILLYAESCLVDGAGLLAGARMGAEHLAALTKFSAEGILSFGCVPLRTIDAPGRSGAQPTYWVSFTERAWALAHALRRERAVVLDAGRVQAALNTAEKKGVERV